jgi:hypothetical protein
VPVPCWFGWETRALPGIDPFTLQRRLETFAAEQCLPQMRKLAPESEIKIRVMNHVSAYAADNKAGIVPLTLKLAGQNETFAVSYCQAGSGRRALAIICGPGDIARLTPPTVHPHRGARQVPVFLGPPGGLGRSA